VAIACSALCVIMRAMRDLGLGQLEEVLTTHDSRSLPIAIQDREPK
jgi:hypothetical protein